MSSSAILRHWPIPCAYKSWIFCGPVKHVCHLENALSLRQTYISQQLMILRRAGIVQSRKVGLQVYYRLTDDISDHVLRLVLGPSNERIPLTTCPCPAGNK